MIFRENGGIFINFASILTKNGVKMKMASVVRCHLGIRPAFSVIHYGR